MARRFAAARLNCESLEARDVPAIVLDATVNDDVTDFAPNSGFVSITELAFDESIQILFRDGSPVDPDTRFANSNDVITLTQSGTSLIITSTDGVYGRTTNLNNALVFYGNSLTISDVTGLNVSLQLGGDDNLTETTTYATNIDSGPGNDVVVVAGGTFNDALAPLFQTPAGVQQVLMFNLISGTPKSIFGGDGNDNLTATGAQISLNMFGGTGNDVLNVPTFASFSNLNGGLGDDTINGPQFGFLVTLIGDAGNDSLSGPLFGQFNFLEGGADRDLVIGGFGVDILIGGTGSDVIVGLGGKDLYLALDVDADFIFNLPGDFVSADTFDSLALDQRPRARRR